MSTKPHVSAALEADFVETLIVAEGLYQAARALYERISKDTGFPNSEAKLVLLDRIQEQGRLIRKTIDEGVQDWSKRW